MISNSSSETTRIFRNGSWIDETHLMASGNPPAADTAADTPALDEWTLDVGTESAGVEMRFAKGRKYYRARAWLDDDRYPGERGPIFSKEFRACDEADAQRVTGHHVDPHGMQHQRDIAAAVARSHMNPQTHASPRDMQNILRELVADLEYPYRLWMQKNERHFTRLRASVELRAVIDIMALDVEENGMVDEYVQFAAQLKMLMKGTD